MPDDGRQLYGLISRAYDAALGQDDWGSVLGGLSRLLGSDSTVTLHPTGTPMPTDAAIRIQSDPDYVPLYNAYYHQTWPVLPKLPGLAAGSVFVDRMLVPATAFIRTEFYNDYAKPQGRHSGLYWIDVDRHGLAAHLSLWRSRRRPDWGQEEIRLLQHLGPHIGRALKIQVRLTAASARAPDASAPPLTPRERDCLAWIARGASSKQAARGLALSVHTVNEYVASAMRKLRATSRSEAVATALSLGLLTP
ncbi:response regulator transcription factor [Inquilinus limosus]|uniref:response regulator transcription factor n=1 Tax=Inquilinus limosus TaxID=171674 RepID=UPI0003FEC287|nr:helix-turn-helix transcriptional regulator [Inquilinus limosus]